MTVFPSPPTGSPADGNIDAAVQAAAGKAAEEEARKAAEEETAKREAAKDSGENGKGRRRGDAKGVGKPGGRAAGRTGADASDTPDIPEDDTLRLTRRGLRDGLSGPSAEADPWGALALAPGRFSFHELHMTRDLPFIHTWMNDPEVARWWRLGGDVATTADHLAARARLAHATAYVGCLDDRPVSYWELYRADLDPLARHYAAQPHDIGVHMLIGPSAHRGLGLGSLLLLVVGDLILRAAPETRRVIGEPDVRNAAAITAFRRAGFRHDTDVTLPDRTAALMIRDRHHDSGRADSAESTDPEAAPATP